VFAAAILVTGVLSGVAGATTTVLVHAIEHLVYGYTQGPMLIGVSDAAPVRRVAGPALGCGLAGLGWWLLRRKTVVPSIDNAIRGGRPFSRSPMVFDAGLQVLAVGAGASLGREAAPRMFAVVLADLAIRMGSIRKADQQILIGSAAGAGLAAVYNVPAAGVLFTVGIVLRSRRTVTVLVAVATSCIATVTAWPVSHGAPTFVWPHAQYSWGSLLFTLAAIPLAALVGAGFARLMTLARPQTRPRSWTLIPAIGLAGLTTGACSIWVPLLPGNGKSIVIESLLGGGTLAVLGAAVVLKPALTALFIRAGAVGGMLTPPLATGAATGAFIAVAINTAGGHASVPAFSLICAAAVLGITAHAPVFAAVFTAELTHPPLTLCVMLLLATLGAHTLLRVIADHRGPTRSRRTGRELRR
jgi:H+/Cl- antiporter ClcA